MLAEVENNLHAMQGEDGFRTAGGPANPVPLQYHARPEQHLLTHRAVTPGDPAGPAPRWLGRGLCS